METAGIYEITLRAPDGRERTELVWLPTDAIRREFHQRAAKNGLEVIEKELKN